MSATARLDVMTTDAGARVRRAHARDLAAVVVQHLHRLIKLAQMHAIDNQAVRRSIDAATETLREYQLKAGEPAVLFFARGVVFFGGEPLKAPRGVYDAALELGGWIERCGGSELAFARDVTTADLRNLASAIVGVQRGRSFGDVEMARVRVRQVSDAALLRGHDVERLEPEQRIVRTYASAVVVLRRFFEELAEGQTALPRRIKRIAQNLVDLSAGKTPAFLGVTAVRNANHDEAGRAVNSAILAVAMGRQITTDPVILTRIAMAAMLYDVGRPHALRALRLDTDDGGPIAAQLGEEAELDLPAETAAVLTALGRVNEPSIVRTVVAFEAQWLQRAARLGAVYRGLRPPTLHARIVSVARAYNELLTPTPGEPIRSPTDALLELEEQAGARAAASAKLSTDSIDRTVLRLLMGALGVLPPGTLVELSSGEIAVVVEVGAGLPLLRIVLDASGGMPEQVVQLHLGADARSIVKLLGADPTFAARRNAAAVLPSIAPPSVPSVITTSGVRAAPAIAPIMTPVVVTPPPPPRLRASEPRIQRVVEPVVERPSSDDDRTVISHSPFDDGADEPISAPTPPPISRPSRPPPAAPPSRPEPRRPAADSARPSRARPPALPPPSRRPADPPSGDRPSAPPAVRAMAPLSDPLISSRPVPSTGPITSPTPPPTTLSSTYGRTADVRGAIQRAPLPNLLVHVLGRGLTGSLVLHDGSIDHVVVFDAGAATKVRLGTTSPRLGEVLVGMGRVESDVVAAAVRRANAARRLLGKQLVIDGVLRPADVVEGLVAQATDRLALLTALPDAATYEFFTGHDVLRELEPVVLDPLATILATVRAWQDERFIDSALARLESRPLSLHGSADVTRFGLTDEESAAVEWATTGNLSVGELLAEELADPRVVRRVVYALLVTKHLDFGGDPLGVVIDAPRDSAPQRVTWPSGIPASSGSIRVERESAPPSDPYERPSFPPPSGAFPVGGAGDAPVILRNSYDALPQPSSGPITGPVEVRIVEKEILTVDEPEPAPPSTPAPSSDREAPASSPDADPRRQAILDAAATLGQRNHYELLGVEPDATLAQIQASFLAAAKRFHPDKLPAELADLKDAAGKVFSAVADAHRTVTDQAKRAAYDEDLASGRKRGDEREEVERVLNASTDFQKAEIMLKRHDNEAALRYAQAAAEADPTQAEYLALYGWLVSMKTDKVAVQKGKDMLDRAVSMDPDSDRALYYRGTVLKRLGKLDEAVRDFRRAADLNEKNLDAVREVRLHEMRASSGRLKKDEGGGLFGGLFKKKK
ncbi:MAG: DnaJ domain-containing protein [Myxococcales bacterium]|nr:DnaJ domain-containing protein [Myxococcales bacterium]